MTPVASVWCRVNTVVPCTVLTLTPVHVLFHSLHHRKFQCMFTCSPSAFLNLSNCFILRLPRWFTITLEGSTYVYEFTISVLKFGKCFILRFLCWFTITHEGSVSKAMWIDFGYGYGLNNNNGVVGLFSNRLSHCWSHGFRNLACLWAGLDGFLQPCWCRSQSHCFSFQANIIAIDIVFTGEWLPSEWWWRDYI